MNKPRRDSDLGTQDLNCLIEMCEKRLHTISISLKRTIEADNSRLLVSARQMNNILLKLRKLRERITTATCDGA
jgi:hypothetical protein